MTGWQIGYAAGIEQLKDEDSSIQASCASSVSQAAATLH